MLKVSSVYRSFETIRSRKQQWKHVRLDDSYLDFSNDIFQDRDFEKSYCLAVENGTAPLGTFTVHICPPWQNLSFVYWYLFTLRSVHVSGITLVLNICYCIGRCRGCFKHLCVAIEFMTLASWKPLADLFFHSVLVFYLCRIEHTPDTPVQLRRHQVGVNSPPSELSRDWARYPQDRKVRIPKAQDTKEKWYTQLKKRRLIRPWSTLTSVVLQLQLHQKHTYTLQGVYPPGVRCQSAFPRMVSIMWELVCFSADLYELAYHTSTDTVGLSFHIIYLHSRLSRKTVPKRTSYP